MTARMAGFTVVELMITVSVLTIFATTALGLGSQAAREHRTMAGYQRDVSECRAALALLETDLRGATAVEPRVDGVFARSPTGEVCYTLVGTELWRRDPDGKRRVARCVGALRVTVDDGRLVRLELGIRPRSGRQAVITSAVCMRRPGERR